MDEVLRFQEELFHYLDNKYPEVLDEIRTKQVLSPELEDKLSGIITEFKKEFR